MRDNEAVPIGPRALVEQGQLAQEIARLERMLKPDVVRIKHTIGSDWAGEPALFLRILLSDAASEPGRLQEVTSRVSELIAQQIDPFHSWGVVPYMRFRSQSEQEALQEPAWT
jgi:hypothetical protein